MKKILTALSSTLLLFVPQCLQASTPFQTPQTRGTVAVFSLNSALTQAYDNADVQFFSSTPSAFPDLTWTSGAPTVPTTVDDVTSNVVPFPLLIPGQSTFFPLTGTTRMLKGKACLSGSFTCQRFNLDIIQYAFVSNFGTKLPVKAPFNQAGLFREVNVEATPDVTIAEPYQIALNRSDTRAYIASRADSQVFQCSLDADQSFTACADSGNTGVPFDDPSGITLNNNNTYAYVTNQEGGTTGAISVCPILDNGSFGACMASENTSFAFSCPNGIALNSAGTRAYVADGCTNIVTMCPVQANGNLGDCVDAGAGAGASFNLPVGLAIPPSSGFIYVTNYGGDSVSQCFFDATTGLFSSCVDAGATSLSDPFGITLTRLGNVAYVSNTGSNSITRFQVQADGTFGPGTLITGANLNIPIWMTLD